MTSRRLPVLIVFVVAWLLNTPLPAGATATANSTLDFRNLAITPAAGTLSFDGPWTFEAFAHADNSLGEIDGQFSSSISPGTVSASAAVTWVSASATASAPNDPPDLVVTGSALSDINIPCCGAAFSTARGTSFNSFTISGTGSVPVQFSIDISGFLHVMTDASGLFARTETIFNLDVDGTPVLFNFQILSIGPNDTQTLSFSTTLTNNIMLDAGVPHLLILNADPNQSAYAVPEPSVVLLLIAGLVALGAARRRTVRRMAD